MEPDRDLRPFLLFLLITVVIICAGLFTPLRDRIEFHIDDLKARIFYLKNDPANTLFVPQGQQAAPTEEPTTEPTLTPTFTELPPTATLE